VLLLRLQTARFAGVAVTRVAAVAAEPKASLVVVAQEPFGNELHSLTEVTFNEMNLKLCPD